MQKFKCPSCKAIAYAGDNEKVALLICDRCMEIMEGVDCWPSNVKKRSKKEWES